MDVLVAFRDVYVLVTNDSGANVAFSNSSTSISAQGPASFVAPAGEMPARRAERLQSCLVDWFLLEVRVHWPIRRTSTSLFDSQLVAQLAASLQAGRARKLAAFLAAQLGYEKLLHFAA